MRCRRSLGEKRIREAATFERAVVVKGSMKEIVAFADVANDKPGLLVTDLDNV
jgi:hypothetical protein